MDKKQFFSELHKLKPIQIIEHDVTESRFIDIFSAVHKEEGQPIYEREKFYFSKILLENPELAECTPLSLFSVFLDVATKGLSLENSSKALCYITFRNIKKRTANGDVWEKRALLDISGYGELVLRERAGQVRYADNPEVIYQGEEYYQKNNPDGVQIYHTIKHPRPSNNGIILIYVRIVRPDGSVTFGTLDNEGIERLKGYSAKNNGKWSKVDGKNVKVPGAANHLYSDTGFLKAKCLKHSFQSFPKLKLNNFSAITEAPEQAEELGLNSDIIKDIPEMDKPLEEVKEELKGVTVTDNDNIF